MINYIFQYQLVSESLYLKGTAVWLDQYIGVLHNITQLLPLKYAAVNL